MLNASVQESLHMRTASSQEGKQWDPTLAGCWPGHWHCFRGIHTNRDL